MAYTGTIVDEADMQFYAGSNVDSGGDTETNHNQLAAEAEAYLCNLVKYDIVSNWGDLNSTFKEIFSEYAARYAAIGLITYNMGSYNTRIEAEDMINVNWERMKKIERLLEKADVQDFMEI